MRVLGFREFRVSESRVGDFGTQGYGLGFRSLGLVTPGYRCMIKV